VANGGRGLQPRNRRGGRRVSILSAAIAAALLGATTADAAPSNDRFAQAQPADPLPFTTTLDTRSATNEAEEPRACPTGPRRSVWYRFTPPGTTDVQIRTVGTTYRSSVAVFTGTTLPSLSLVGCHSGEGGGTITLEAAADVTYYVRVASSEEHPDGGDLRLAVLPIGPAANDDFDDAREIAAFPFADVVDGSATTAAPDDPPSTCVVGTGQTIWYRLSSPVRQAFELNNVGTQAPNVTVYTGMRGELTEVACVRGTPNRLRFVASPGVTYHIAVAEAFFQTAELFALGVDTVKMDTSLELSRKTAAVVRAGRQSRFVARLRGVDVADTPHRSLVLYETWKGTTHAIRTVALDANGVADFTLRPRLTASYFVAWPGDDRYEAATSTKQLVSVRAHVRLTVLGARRRAGKDAVFRAGADPILVARLQPNRQTEKLRIQIWIRFRGEWLSAFNRGYAVDPGGRVALRLIDPPAGYRYRVRSEYLGGGRVLPAKSSFTFFRVVS
jgi:hypothetical protein